MGRVITNLLALTLVALATAAPQTVWADEPPVEAKPKPEKKASVDALDDELLQGLENDLLDGLDLPGKKLGAKPSNGAQPAEGDAPRKPAASDIDDELGRQLGEDVELGGESDDPLGRIGEKMRRAEELIAKSDPHESTQQLQKRIVADLDALIKNARKNQQQRQDSNSSSPSQASTRSEVKPGGQPGEASRRSARDSTDRLGKDELREVDMEHMKELFKDLWGHLPERAREQMMQSSVEQFLPKYELMIERYFRRLADDPSPGAN